MQCRGRVAGRIVSVVMAAQHTCSAKNLACCDVERSKMASTRVQASGIFCSSLKMRSAATRCSISTLLQRLIYCPDAWTKIRALPSAQTQKRRLKATQGHSILAAVLDNRDSPNQLQGTFPSRRSCFTPALGLSCAKKLPQVRHQLATDGPSAGTQSASLPDVSGRDAYRKQQEWFQPLV